MYIYIYIYIHIYVYIYIPGRRCSHYLHVHELVIAQAVQYPGGDTRMPRDVGSPHAYGLHLAHKSLFSPFFLLCMRSLFLHIRSLFLHIRSRFLHISLHTETPMVSIHTHTHTHTYTYIYTHIHIYTQTHEDSSRLLSFVPGSLTHARSHTHTHTHTHAHIYIHTHTHT